MSYIYTNLNHLDLDQNIRIFEYFASTNIFALIFGSNLILRIYSYSYSFKMDISNIFDIRIRGKKLYSSRTVSHNQPGFLQTQHDINYQY